jgi:hypothetical protein
MRHLQPSPLESTLDIKSLVRFRAIQNRLVAAYFLGNKIKRLDKFETEFLALLVFRNSDVFDMANEAEIVDAVNRPTLA